MLFSLGHGQHIIDMSASRRAIAGDTPLDVELPGDAIPLDAVVELDGSGGQPSISPPLSEIGTEPEGGAFAYFFPEAPPLPEADDMPARLDAVAIAMTEQNGASTDQNLAVPPVFTYLGQFIDHDITANTDRETGLSTVADPCKPKPRDEVASKLFNLRDGSLRLDSIYGDRLIQGDFAKKLSRLMRHPNLPDKMRLAIPQPVPGQATPFPQDPAADLLRLGFLMDKALVTQAELDGLEPELRKTFLRGDGTPRVNRAIIGDGRNDENLIVAQLHMSFLRFHNKLVDAKGSFDEARQLMCWHYQWLVVNEYCRTVCDPAIVDEVIAREAPLYSDFLDANSPADPAQLPLPLEFSAAAFRFGHSMVRGGYDHNRFFGEAVPGFPNIQGFARFDQLFAFTGNGDMSGFGPKLPSNWVIEWDRFVRLDPAHPNRSARKIDTSLADPLSKMINESGDDLLLQHLAKRNLRRGYRLSIPTGQACLAALKAGHYPDLGEPLTRHELSSGAAGEALDAAGLANGATPLWFYILKEAEVRAQGKHLGPVGSVLVAETLIGLVVKDPDSYWTGGPEGGRWSPVVAGLPGGPVDSMAKLLRFAGMLA